MTGHALPLVFIDQPGGIVIACLCGAEATTVRNGLANDTMTGLRSSGQSMQRLAADVSPAGVLRVVLHARKCVPGRNAGLQLNRAIRAEAPHLLEASADQPPGQAVRTRRQSRFDEQRTGGTS